jgi:hypothetical protein
MGGVILGYQDRDLFDRYTQLILSQHLPVEIKKPLQKCKGL